MSEAIKRQLKCSSEKFIVCEQCALVRYSEIEVLCRASAKIGDLKEECPTCAALKQQVEAAEMERERVRELPESAKMERKWAYLHRAFLEHEYKAHNQDARGKV